MLETLDHIVIGVHGLEDATETLARLLGRRPSWQGRHPAYGTANTLFRLDKTYLELISPVGPGSLGDLVRATLDQYGDGLFALAFGTPDAAACAHDLRARGLQPADPVEGSGRETTSGVERRWRNVMLPQSETRGVTLFAIEHRSAAELLPPAAAGEAEDAAIYGVDHVVVNSSDPEATAALYRDRLGIRLALDKSFPDWGMRLMFFRIGGITVEIAAPLGAEPGQTDRLWGISYQVRDIDVAVARLARDGFDVSEVRTGRRPGTRVATVRDDPCGVATLLIQPVQ
jgi:catechol 2,3-dioxygenase-like lactoylglutathione lyase family enzyme